MWQRFRKVDGPTPLIYSFNLGCPAHLKEERESGNIRHDAMNVAWITDYVICPPETPVKTKDPNIPAVVGDVIETMDGRKVLIKAIKYREMARFKRLKPWQKEMFGVK